MTKDQVAKVRIGGRSGHSFKFVQEATFQVSQTFPVPLTDPEWFDANDTYMMGGEPNVFVNGRAQNPYEP